MISSNNNTNNKRLAKNTLMLYVRTLLIMLVTLYTTRVVLKYLGVEDYGVYNVVGGVVSILASINGAMSGAASRFTSFALGQNDKSLCDRTFSTLVITHWILAGIILFLGETIGLWFVINKLVIPEGREMAAMICYQGSLGITLLSILNVPYNASIIGHERMDSYAYISIVEALLRLSVAFALMWFSRDKLILYSLLMFCVQGIVILFYRIFCRNNFSETRAKLLFDKTLLRQIASFAGWTFSGQLACAGYTQGINVLINLFFGPAVNAARGISVQVQNAAKILVNNFQIALRPQMIKTWAVGDIEYMHKLVVYSSKFSFFLTALVVFPLTIVIAPVLSIWLGDVPDHTIAFVRIILYSMLVDSFNHGMIVSAHATGDIKRFQIWESASLLTIVPIAYLLLKFCHITAEQVMWVYLVVQLVTQIIRVSIVLPQIKMKIYRYIFDIFPRVILVFAFLFPLFFTSISINSSFIKTIVYFVCSLLIVATIIYIVGLNKNEKIMVINFAKGVIHKMIKH